MKEIICTLDALDAAAGEFLEAIGGNTTIAFYGHLGAGKTTFIKAICDRLGVEDNVCSPTFTIVNEYQSAAGEPVFRSRRIHEKRDQNKKQRPQKHLFPVHIIHL